MPKVVDELRIKQYKINRLNGKSKTKSLEALGIKPGTANAHCSDSPVVNRGEREIIEEIDKAELAKKAYLTLKNNLTAEKASDRNTAASAILDFTEGKKSTVDNINPDKVILIQTEDKKVPLPTENKNLSAASSSLLN